MWLCLRLWQMKLRTKISPFIIDLGLCALIHKDGSTFSQMNTIGEYRKFSAVSSYVEICELVFYVMLWFLISESTCFYLFSGRHMWKQWLGKALMIGMIEVCKIFKLVKTLLMKAQNFSSFIFKNFYTLFISKFVNTMKSYLITSNLKIHTPLFLLGFTLEHFGQSVLASMGWKK